jgi:hypothetical protein
VSEKRPFSLQIYCGLLALLVCVGAALGVQSLARAPMATIMDAILAFTPLVILAVAVAGFWSMRWWGVFLLWFLVLAMIATMVLAPFPAPGISLTQLAISAMVWIGLLALPPTVIAVIHRRRFR